MILNAILIITSALLAYALWQRGLTIDLLRDELERKQKLIDQYNADRAELCTQNDELERRNAYLEEVQERIDAVRARVNGAMERSV